MSRTVARLVVGLAALLPAGFVAMTYPRFRRDMRAGRERLRTGSHLAATAFGDIEFADWGSGPPVLLVHGAGGGYDQGLLIGQTFVGEGYRFIAPSRFGYLRSGIPAGGSPATQADAYAALLDSLGVDRVAAVAFSDGGPSALQFALRHPDRCAALVMLSAKSQTPPPQTRLQTLVQTLVFSTIFRSDYLFWSITAYLQPFLLSVLGVPREVQEQATPRARQYAARAMDLMHPISLRRDGIYHDMATMAVLPEDLFQLERIAAPTLVVHTVDDGLQVYAHGQHTATRVPNAQLVSYDRGGHLLVLEVDDIREKVAAFLERHYAETSNY